MTPPSRRAPAPISLPPEFWKRWNDSDLALGRVGHGLRLLDDWLCRTSGDLSVEDQNRLGFFVDSLLLHLETAETRLREVGEAAKAVEGRHP